MKNFTEIVVIVDASDGFVGKKKYKTLKSASAYAIRYVGKTPEIGSSYAASADGVCTVEVSGTLAGEPVKLSDLFAAPIKKTETPKNEEKKMDTKKAFKMTENFVIDTKDMVHGKLGKQKPYSAAKPAVKAVTGIAAVEAIAAVKDKKGKVTAKAIAAVEAVAAIAAVAAKPEVLESSEIYLRCLTLEIANECIARIQDQGIAINYDDMIFEEGGYQCFSFTTTAKAGDPKGTAMKMWRAVVKACKVKSGYNAPGIKVAAEKAKAAAKAEKAAEKAKTKAAEKKETDAATKKKDAETPAKKKTDTKVEEDAGDGWPE